MNTAEQLAVLCRVEAEALAVYNLARRARIVLQDACTELFDPIDYATWGFDRGEQKGNIA